MILQYLLEFISFVLDLSNKRLCYNKYVCCSFCEVMLNADFPNSVLEGNQSTCWALIFMNDMEIYYCVPPLTHYAWNPCEVHEPASTPVRERFHFYDGFKVVCFTWSWH